MKAKIKILGISGSPRQNGNTDIIIKEALRGARALASLETMLEQNKTGFRDVVDQGEVETEFIGLAGKDIHPCDGCGEVCFREDRCFFDDGFMEIYRQMLDADGIIFGSPIHAGFVTARCATLIERCYYGQARAQAEKRKAPLGLKVGGAFAIGSSRHSGYETTLQQIFQFFIRNEMIPIGLVSPGGQIGPTATARDLGQVIDDEWFITGRPERSVHALDVAFMYGRKVSIATKIFKTGIQETGLEIPPIV